MQAPLRQANGPVLGGHTHSVHDRSLVAGASLPSARAARVTHGFTARASQGAANQAQVRPLNVMANTHERAAATRSQCSSCRCCTQPVSTCFICYVRARTTSFKSESWSLLPCLRTHRTRSRLCAAAETSIKGGLVGVNCWLVQRHPSESRMRNVFSLIFSRFR